ncbi:hypothetical protein RJ639_026505 [Escallonia herrerae]|uniref:Malectin-like domain-containing protein n=1 Tax=Escallonia herrerae TaxID=1293975 RepID=A0AA88UX19_9ASTE|nr:hypothetical protein RJ639_026505 [Escallonia herrerae]
MEIHANPAVFLYISLSLLLHLTATSSFSPADSHLINCGSAEPTTVDSDDRRFTGDSGIHFLTAAKTVPLQDPNPTSSSSPIYHSARVFTRPSSYAFGVREKGIHLVRIHFKRFNSERFNLFDAQFHVSVNGYVLLYNFTGESTQKDRPRPVIKDYVIWVDTEKLVITFTPSEKSRIGFVSAIEVISAPKDLIADMAQSVSSEKNERVDGLLKNAFETVYRINVGGLKVTPLNDSLWRTWLPDEEFLKSSDNSRRVFFSGRIRYQLGRASREVGPDNVYNSARVVASSNDLVPRANITWAFTVTEGYRYLVRLHFCDIASVSLGILYFNVYVNGNLAYGNLDLSSETYGRLASPFYADFLVDGDTSGVLTVSVGPSNRSMPHEVDALLNGIEVMKVNNSMASLDGEVSVKSVLRSPSRENVGVLIPLVAAVCLFLTASIFMQWRRTGVKDSVAWSRLPVDGSAAYSKV